MTKKKFRACALIGLLSGGANGLFGAGGGSVLVPCMEKYLNVIPQKAHATAIAVILPLSVISAFFYIFKSDLLTGYIIYAGIGGTAGSLAGSLLLSKLTGKWLHRIFGLFMIVAAVRMIL